MNTISMKTIDYYDEDYNILEIKELDDKNKYRTIKYGTGFYALQKWKNSSPLGEEWDTICISPKLDVNTDNWVLTEGQYDVSCLLGCIESNFNFKNGGYWELKVQVNEKDYDGLTEIIKREDGEILLNELFKLNRLQKLQMLKYYNEEWNWKWIFRINTIIWIIIVLLVFLHI